MKNVNIRGVEIGAGMPKIAIAIVGATKREIISSAASLRGEPCDIVEWRADHFERALDIDASRDVLLALRETLGEMPILCTLRTAGEGGEVRVDDDDYKRMLIAAIDDGIADAIDVEIFSWKSSKEIVDRARERSMITVGSFHSFDSTPAKEIIEKKFFEIHAAGADIAKIAVMPKDSRDVITLLGAAASAHSIAPRPIVAISMGLGAISRVVGETIGSSITFGSAGRSSAPGQLAAKELKQVLETLHRSLEEF